MPLTRTKTASLLALAFASPLFLVAGDAAAAERAPFDARADSEALASVVQLPFKSLCAESAIPGFQRCFAKIVSDGNGIVVPAKAPSGFGAQDVQSAYVLPTTGGGGKLIAAVDAYDYPNAEADLAVYRAQYGLPACTTANGCFKKVDENGGTSFPGTDPQGGCTNGWSGETSLDLQMLSATCPDCHILLVEADAPDNSLQTAVNTAAKLGAVAISNSYGGAERSGNKSSESVYTHPGIWITASAGDSGFGAAYPATSAGVVAVGGTTLKKSASSRGWAESAWKGSGSGCSAEIAKPAWQTDPTCKNRMEADVAAVADPSTGVAVYCTDPGGAGGWGVVGGTSVAAPLIAGAFTVLGVTPDPSFAWKNPSLFFDVTTGSNGTCTTDYFCTAGTGYDGPTGWGTPNGALITKAPQGGGTDADAGAADGGDAKDAEAEDATLGDASTGATADAASGADTGAGASPTSSDDAGATSSGASSGSGGLGSGGTGTGSGSGGATGSGATSSDPGGAGSSGGCAMTSRRAGETGGAALFGVGLLIALGARRRRGGASAAK
jgi:hypothetical protein